MVTRTGDATNETIDGSTTADTLDGAAGNDTINGLAGDDLLYGSDGADVIDGGAGNDRINAGRQSDPLDPDFVFVLDPSGAGADTIFGGDGDDTVSGYGNTTMIFGGAGNDNLQGGPDQLSDTIDGGTGADVMIGQGGADVYIVDEIGDFVAEYEYDSYGADTNTATGDVDEIRSSISYTMRDWNDDGFNVENLTLTGSADLSATANEVGNVVSGNSGDNVLSGLAGDDTIIGGGGDDTIDGGTGDDELTGGAGADVFRFAPGDGDDTITDFVVGVDTIEFSGTDVRTTTENAAGDQVITLNNDVTVTLEGVPVFVPPVPAVAAEGLNLLGTPLADTLAGGDEADQIRGRAGNDLMRGGDGGDLLQGEAGNDTIYGGDGDDVIVGGSGSNVLIGGAGRDSFVIAAGSTAKILDFEEGVDQIIIEDMQSASGVVTVVPSSYINGNATDAVVAPFENLIYTQPATGGGTFIGAYNGTGVLTQIEVNGPSQVDPEDGADVGTAPVLTDPSDLTSDVRALYGTFGDIVPTDHEVRIGEVNTLRFGMDGSRSWDPDLAEDTEIGVTIIATLPFAVADQTFSETLSAFRANRLSEIREVTMRDAQNDPAGRMALDENSTYRGELDGWLLEPGSTVRMAETFRSVLSEADSGPFLEISALALSDVTVDPVNPTPVVQRTEFTVNENGALTPTSVSVIVGDDAPVGLDLTNQNTPGVPFDGTAPTNPPSSDTQTSIRVDVNTDVANGSADINELFGTATPRGGGPAEFMENLSFESDGGRGALRGIVNLEGLQAAQALGLAQGIDPDLIQEAIRNYFNVSLGSAVIDIDLDLDGVSDIVITADGDFDTPEFRLEPIGDGAVAFSMYTGNTDAQGRVSIYGARVVGEVLETDIANVYDAEGIDETTVTYQWLRDGAAITGATGDTHTLGTADIGGFLSVQASFTDGFGNEESISSAPTRPISAQNTALSGSLSITGNTGLFEALRANTEGLIDPDGIVVGTEAFQWYSNGQPIDGATDSLLIVTADLLGSILTVQVQFFDGDGVLETMTSSPRAVGGGILGTDNIDQLNGTSANDLVDGLAGADTLAFTGAQSNYTVVLSAQGTFVEDRRDGGDGVDQIAGIETLGFLDNDWRLDIFSNITTLTEEAFSTFIEMYIAYFNRAPDAEGLFFWGNALSTGTDLDTIAALFFDQDETRGIYGDEITDFEEFAKEVYSNVLGRDFDQAGLDFWVGVLEGGTVPLPTFMLEIIRGAKAEPQPGDAPELTAQKLADVAYLGNKTDVGAYFSVIKGMSDVENARAVMELYDGSQSSIEASVAAIDADFAAAESAGSGEFLLSLVGVVDDPFAIA